MDKIDARHEIHPLELNLKLIIIVMRQDKINSNKTFIITWRKGLT